MRRRDLPRGLTLALLLLAGCASDTSELRRQAAALRSEGRVREATQAYLALAAALPGDDRDSRLARTDAFRELGGMHASFGDPAEAERAYLSALRTAEAEPRLPPETIVTLRAQLAALSYRAGRNEEAAERYEEVLLLERRSLGEAHPDVLATVGILSGLRMKCGRPDMAEPLLRRQLALTERSHGPGRRETAACLDRMAEARDRLGRNEEAAALRRKAGDIRKKLCDEC
ncbi:MAG: tetratricopeptide repeat protein [Opitutia bacterium]